MKHPELALQLLQCGLIQFGRFQLSDGHRPFLLNLDYLPAYPGVLAQAADAAASVLDGIDLQRLVALPEAVPFGVAVALRTGVSLVYSRGRGEETVYDLAGAYNIGHAAVLVANTLADLSNLHTFVTSARRVGLEIHSVLPMIDLGINTPEPGLQSLPLLALPDVVRLFSSSGHLPAGLARAVLDWIETQSGS